MKSGWDIVGIEEAASEEFCLEHSIVRSGDMDLKESRREENQGIRSNGLETSVMSSLAGKTNK